MASARSEAKRRMVQNSTSLENLTEMVSALGKKVRGSLLTLRFCQGRDMEMGGFMGLGVNVVM